MVLTVKEQLREDGYSVVANLLSEEDLAEVTSATEELITRWQIGEIQDEDFRTYISGKVREPVLYRIHNLEKKHPCIERVFEFPALVDLIHTILGEGSGPTAFALIIKMPYFGGQVPYHSDPIAVEPGTVYNFSIFLDDSTVENGCLEVVPGSHLLPPITEPFGERPEGSVFVTARAGDVVIHDVRILHGSAFSRSPKLRRSICVEFQPAHMLEKLG
jgi:phytanoyl-CoA hydroxylase